MELCTTSKAIGNDYVEIIKNSIANTFKEKIMDPITLKEYIKTKQEELYTFQIMWEEEQKNKPEVFPEKLNIGDWEEQMALYGGK